MQAGWWVLVLLVGPAGVASANPSEADKGVANAKARLGFDRLAKGDYRGGIEALEQGHDLVADPRFLYNIAVAYEKWDGHCEEAGRTYRRYLEECAGCREENIAKEKLALLSAVCPGLRKGPRKEGATLRKQSVEGWSEIRGDLRAAREGAIKDGLARAVEMIGGVEIESLMEDRSMSTIHDHRERFQQEVKSRIYAQSKGFIRQYDVLREEREGSLFRVLLAVEVDTDRLRDQLGSIAHRIAQARHPKILLLSRETYVGKDGRENSNVTALRALLEAALVKKGFELVRSTSDLAETGDRDAVAAANVARADYLMVAELRIQHVGFNRLGAQEHYADAELAVRTLEVPTSVVVANERRTGKSPYGVFSEAEIVQRTTAHVGASLPDDLTERLLAAFDRNEATGARYLVRLLGVSSYASVAEQFLGVLKRQLGVTMVKELGYDSSTLEVEVRFPASVDVSVLRLAIIKEARKLRALERIEVEPSSGHDLSFSLEPKKGTEN